MTRRSTTQRDKDRATIARGKPACAICGAAIDYTLSVIEGQHGAKCQRPDCLGCVPHPMRFEADHIIPLGPNPTPERIAQLDVLSNKQATHRKCNSAKRARLVAPIVRRSGSLG